MLSTARLKSDIIKNIFCKAPPPTSYFHEIWAKKILEVPWFAAS
jgi:hypothetical protein